MATNNLKTMQVGPKVDNINKNPKDWWKREGKKATTIKKIDPKHQQRHQTRITTTEIKLSPSPRRTVCSEKEGES